MKIIENHQDQLVHQVGCPVHVKKILVQNLEKARDVSVNASVLTTSQDEIINDPSIDVIIEVMGGVEETRSCLIEALKRKKNVVTANKDLMALHGPELLTTASQNGCDLYYEASVGGGIPIIRSLADGLASDKITKIMGIMNGTTNYILTKMSQEGAAYPEVLKEAQSLGYAEADPTSDVEGLDAARKMSILASLGFSMKIDLEDVQVKGISAIKDEDISYGKQLGYTMKLIGVAQCDQGKVEVSVKPAFLLDSHPLAAVHNEFNAVYVYGEAVGETMFYGPGAGGLPTATAIVSDLVYVLKNMRLGVSGRNSVTPQFSKSLKSSEEMYSKYYLRLHVQDEVGVFSEITALFARHGASFEKILQLPLKESGLAEVVLVTHQISLHNYEQIVMELEDLKKLREIKGAYQVAGGNAS